MAQTGIASLGTQQFNGTGIYSTVNSNQLAGGQTLTQPVVYLAGSSVGGKPGTVLRLTSESSARAVLKGGDLLNAFLFAQRHGAGEVDVFRVDQATQSSLLLYDSSSNPSTLLTSVDYGEYTNGFSASIAGSTGNLIATFVSAYDGISLTSPALGPALTVKYTGNATAATLTIVKSLSAVGSITLTANTTGGTIAASTAVSVQAIARNASGIALAGSAASVTTGSGTSTNSVSASWTAVSGATSYDVYVGGLYYGNTATGSITLTFIPVGTSAIPTVATSGPNLVTALSGQTDGSVNLDISLASANVSSVSSLASYLSGQIGYSATTSTGAGAITSTLVDAVSSQSILNTAYQVTADEAAVLNWFNGTGYVTATQPNGATNAPAVVGLSPFTGGSSVAATTAQWQNAADSVSVSIPLLRYPVALTSDSANQTIFSTAVTKAAAKMTTFFSRGFFGGGTSDSDATAEQNAATLGSQRAYYLHPDFYDYDSSGVYTHFPSYMLAACTAGLAAAGAPQQPLTGQVLLISALGSLDANGLPISEDRALALAEAGVSSAYKAADGTIKIYQGISTDLIAADQTNTYAVEFSVGNQVDQVRLYVAQNLSEYRGGENYGDPTQQTALAKINGLLANCVKFKWISGYLPATQLTPVPGNSTFLTGNATLIVVNPINGIIMQFSLQYPTFSQVA